MPIKLLSVDYARSGVVIPRITNLPQGIKARLRPETRQGYLVVCVALWSVLSFLAFSTFLYSSVIVEGQSMTPTLQPGDHYLLNRWFHRFFPFQSGEMVVLQDRFSRDKVVKRIIGLPQDTIQIRNDGVYRNGQRLTEEYLPPNTYTPSLNLTDRVLKLGAGEYFVLGDNRGVSEDSRHFGPVRSLDILGVLGPII